MVGVPWCLGVPALQVWPASIHRYLGNKRDEQTSAWSEGCTHHSTPQTNPAFRDDKLSLTVVSKASVLDTT